jgi:hypothetical protein
MHLRTQKINRAPLHGLTERPPLMAMPLHGTSRERLNLSCMRDTVITAARPSCIACVMDGWLVVRNFFSEMLFP